MIYLLPVLNAIFGWAIISILFYFLFHPLRKKSIAIFEVQGFIPKNFEQWGNEIAEYVSTHFFSIGKIKDDFLQGDQLKGINKMLEEKVDDFLRNKLKEKIPVLSMFITDGLISRMKETLMEELTHMLPATIEKLATDAEKKFDAKKMIGEKMKTISPEQLEILFYSHSRKSLNSLKAVVALTGFVLGCFEILLLKLF